MEIGGVRSVAQENDAPGCQQNSGDAPVELSYALFPADRYGKGGFAALTGELCPKLFKKRSILPDSGALFCRQGECELQNKAAEQKPRGDMQEHAP